MTRQNKIRLVTPPAQNLFLLYNNSSLIRETTELSKKFEIEIKDIKKPGALAKILTKEVGSQALLNKIDQIVKKTDLYNTPQRTSIYALVILMVLGVDPVPLILDLDKNKNALANPIWWNIDPGSEGAAITVSLSNFHTKTDLVSFIGKHWKEVELARNPYKRAKIKIEKPKPYTDFARDWQMYQDKATLSYSKLAKKYGFNEVNSAKIIISKLRKKVASLYSARG